MSGHSTQAVVCSIDSSITLLSMYVAKQGSSVNCLQKGTVTIAEKHGLSQSGTPNNGDICPTYY